MGEADRQLSKFHRWWARRTPEQRRRWLQLAPGEPIPWDMYLQNPQPRTGRFLENLEGTTYITIIPVVTEALSDFLDEKRQAMTQP